MPTTYAIPNGRTVMDATIYTGNGANTSISNIDNGTVGFKPDFVWVKGRTGATNNYLYDSIRGANVQLLSNDAGAESTVTGRMTAFNTNGFSVGTSTEVNQSTYNYVAWQWQAGQGTTSNNTNGTITSTVSANATAGFSIATCTLPNSGTSGTVGHGLGVAPSMYIVKYRTVGSDWRVYHSSLGQSQFLVVNSTAGAASSTTVWNNTAPTSTVLSLGSNYLPDAASNTLIIYSWAEIAGFSKFGSYTGNGSTDGPFIYTGFRPKFVLIKNTSTTGYWMLVDSTRGTYNIVGPELYPNVSDAEDTTDRLDLLSNGFKIRVTSAFINGNTNTMIYAAFAENPFKYANAR